MDFPWMDEESVIMGSLEAWCADFSAARAVSASEFKSMGLKSISDSDLSSLRISFIFVAVRTHDCEM